MAKKKEEYKVAICVETGDMNDSITEILIDSKNHGEFVLEHYVIGVSRPQRTISIFYIKEITEVDRDKAEELRKKWEMSQFFKIDERFLYVTDLEAFLLDTRKEFEKVVSYAIIDINIRFDMLKKTDIDENRKQYLERLYVDDNEAFQKRTKNSKERWYTEINQFDYDINQIASVHRLYLWLLRILEESDKITNIDKIALKGIITKKCWNKADRIIPQGKLNRIMDSPPAIYSDDETKDIIWNAQSKYEFRVNFHFFWDLIKNLLSLIYVPIILVLLQEGAQNRVYLYSVLAIVYIIALYFSNEKQIDRLKEHAKKKDKSLSYADLFSYGMYASIYFVVFSIEMINGLVDSSGTLFIYLLANVVIAFALAYSGVLLSTLVTCLLVRAESFKKKGKIVSAGSAIKKVITTIIYVGSVCAAIWIFGGKDYIYSKTEPSNGQLAIMVVATLFAIFKIIAIWQKKVGNGLRET